MDDQTPVGKSARRMRTLMTQHPMHARLIGATDQTVSHADVHMHTNFSDGMGTVEDVLAHVEDNTDLDVIAITDHDTIEGALRARDLVAAQRPRFELIVGEEISTREGHLLALFIEKRIAPGQSIERSIEQIRDQGGIAIIAHPFNPVFRHSVRRPVFDRLMRQPDLLPDAVESLNGSFAGIGSSAVTMRLCRERYHLPETGSSDAHTPTAIGVARTAFPGMGATGLRAAIMAGETLPLGGFWLAREYVIIGSHRIAYGRAGLYRAAEAQPEVRAARLRATTMGWSARAARRMYGHPALPMTMGAGEGRW